MFSYGNIQTLCVRQLDIVKEMTTCTSFDLGKASFHKKLLGPLLGDGILTSNGTTWAHHRKILAPELYIDKVKGMINIVSESCESLQNLWSSKIEAQNGVADINIDKDLRRFSGNVISRACFGSDYTKGEDIFLKLGALQEIVCSWKNLSSAIPGMRYLPTNTNRKIWKLEKEVKSLILEVVKNRKEKTSFEKDLLQMVIEGFETTAVAATWCLMLLASNHSWQDRARAEVLEICKGKVPDFDMLSKMKQLTMVIHESLRLYPPVPLMSRQVFKDMKFGNIDVPKGTDLWILILTMHTNPDIWGDDAYKFNPERFANGTASAYCSHIAGSCNGLICLTGFRYLPVTPTLYHHREYKYTYWLRLWNPATRAISEKIGCFIDSGGFSFNFGCDNSTGTFKVVASCYIRDQLTCDVRVISFDENVWRNIQSFPVVPFNLSCYGSLEHDAVFFNGTLNWLAIRNDIPYIWYHEDHPEDLTVEQFVIVLLDLGTETYNMYTLPQGFDEVPPERPTVGVLGNCFCLSYSYKETDFIIWQMKRFGIEESWTQFLKINYHDLQLNYCFSNDYFLPLFLSKDGDTLILYGSQERQLFLYNWRDHRVERIGVNVHKTIIDDGTHNNSRWNLADGFVESLTSIC
ncbi:hypothetical protein TSUD_124350 [Trifolium subterraneum]|uniref:F-box associated domain-containing protein n=1 Tax=Trifolium subterraneum TaxID=3900 RepID=A0A2Z6LLZ3_TRISU|nr:hypothetical protein TSUD_124350 [Trifolium subterraneum]